MSIEYIAPSSKEDFNVKEGDIVVSYYYLEENWDDWEPELEEFKEEALESLNEQVSIKDIFPVLIGIVTKCNYEKFFHVFYLICNEHGVVLHANSSYQPFNTNRYWFKYDFEKLGIDKEWLKNNLENTIKNKQKELKDFEILKCNLFKNETKGEHYA